MVIPACLALVRFFAFRGLGPGPVLGEVGVVPGLCYTSMKGDGPGWVVVVPRIGYTAVDG